MNIVVIWQKSSKCPFCGIETTYIGEEAKLSHCNHFEDYVESKKIFGKGRFAFKSVD